MPARGVSNFEALLDEVSGSQDDSVLNAVGRFLSRPGFAVRSLLAGDVPAAGKNLAQMALDFPTGGFLNRSLSLGRLVSDTGDITSARERYSTEDVLRAHGQAAPASALGKLALNFAGDIATDPLTYVTLGEGALAKAGLTGLTEAAAASRLMGALSKTSKGAEILAGIPKPTNIARAVGASEIGSVRGLEAALGLARGGLNNLDAAGSAKVVAEAVKRGLIEEPGALRVLGKPVVSDVFAKLGKATAPGVAYAAARRVAPEATEKVGQALGRAWNFAGREFLDRTIAGLDVPLGSSARRAAAEGNIEANFKASILEKVGARIRSIVPDDARRADLGKVLHAASDEFMATAYGKRYAERKAVADAIQAKIEAGLPENEVQAVRIFMGETAKARHELRAKGVWSGRGKYIHDDDNTLTALQHAVQAQEAKLADLGAKKAFTGSTAYDSEIKAVTKARRRARKVLADYEKAVKLFAENPPKSAAHAERKLGLAAARLRKAGIGLEIDNPFYIPRQLRDEVASAMPRGVALGSSRPGVKTAVLRRRDYATVQEWLESIAEAAKKEGAGGSELARVLEEAAGVGGQIGDVAETDIAKLMVRYGDQIGTSLGRQHLLNRMKELGVEHDPGAVQYMRQVWGGIGRRDAVTDWIAAFNRKFKPAQTVIWPSYHLRNLVGAIAQTMLDPDLGLLDGFSAALRVVTDLPALKLSKPLGVSPDNAVAFMRAAAGDAESVRHVSKLTIAGRDGADVFKGLVGGVLSNAAGEADLFESVSMAQRIGAPVNGGPLAAYETWKRAGYSLAQHVENTMRTHAYLKLIGKGVDPTDAAVRVNKAFVDYRTQGKLDRIVRDVFPFIRFQVAMTPEVAKAAAMRPGGPAMQFLRVSQNLAEDRPAEEQVALPDYMRRGFRLPVGDGTYLGSLGLPQESGAQLIESAFAGEQARQTLAGLSPIIRFPAEKAIGRSFFTGNEFGSDRRAPAFARFMPGLTREFTSRSGDTYIEVPGWVNELVKALPTARFQSAFESVMDSEKPAISKLAKLLLGVSTVTPDQERGVARAVARHFSRLYAQGKAGEARQHWARVADGEDVPEGLAEAVKAEVSLRKGK